MLYLISKLDVCHLLTVGITRRQSKFSRSYPILPYSKLGCVKFCVVTNKFSTLYNIPGNTDKHFLRNHTVLNTIKVSKALTRHCSVLMTAASRPSYDVTN